MLANLFNQNNQEATASGANQLDKTAQLTTLATTIVNDMLKAIESNNDDETTAMVKESMQSHDAMDKLINKLVDLTTTDVDFLKDCDDGMVDRMIKSQQSKRSRSKGKVMTLDNYKSMLTGAVAENLLRLASGKDKASAGFSNRSSEVTYSEEQLQELANDQEKLRAAIRNIQSKKSIAKSKAGFDPNGERWQQLLVAEEQLKSLRIGAPTGTKAVETNSKVIELLANVDDVNSLKGADAKSLLEQVKAMLKQ